MAKVNRRTQAKAQTTQKVLGAAAVLFEKDGYAKATIRDIAREAGMSTGAVFANYEDKAALYVAVYGHPPIDPETARSLRAALQALAVRALEYIGPTNDPSLCDLKAADWEVHDLAVSGLAAVDLAGKASA